ncbi:MAG: DUF1499 domain-containing protein [Roseibium sp.]|uniref:DUF1499 domain-containing protein n=1 Tax=Roseibium sp. TaxID=1936156 RepID=UPI003D9C2620
MKRYAVHRTAAAPASRAIASVALAITVTAFFAKRFGFIDADVFVLSLLFSACVALLAFVAAVVAFQRIWSKGGPGVPAALTAVLFAVAALFPPTVVGGMMITSGGVNDVATNQVDPPELKMQAVVEQQPFLNWTTGFLKETAYPFLSGLPQQAALRRFEPDGRTADIVPRRYRIAPGQLHVAGAKALENLNWTIVDELPPDLLDAATRLQAEGETGILGLKFDVVLRIRPDSVGALLDVRSRSRTSLRDLSTNAGQIRTVFDEIDRVLLETYGNLARVSVEEGEEEEELPPIVLEDQRDVIPLPGFKPYFEDTETIDPDAADLPDLEG